VGHYTGQGDSQGKEEKEEDRQEDGAPTRSEEKITWLC